jgi:hypothetical protein
LADEIAREFYACHGAEVLNRHWMAWKARQAGSHDPLMTHRITSNADTLTGKTCLVARGTEKPMLAHLCSSRIMLRAR